MAHIHGVAGEWARVKGTVGGLWPLFLGLFALGAFVALFLVEPAVAALGTVASLVFIWWTLNRGMRHVERFYKGARGEEKVSGILQSLPGAYHVFNDYLACGTHVDHVVVGPAGVFALETKFWRGRVTVEEGHVLLDGQLPDRDPLAQTRREAELVQRQLERIGWKGGVTPVLVFASDTFNAQPAEIHGAVVMNAGELNDCLCGSGMVLASSEVERLAGLMESNS